MHGQVGLVRLAICQVEVAGSLIDCRDRWAAPKFVGIYRRINYMVPLLPVMVETYNKLAKKWKVKPCKKFYYYQQKRFVFRSGDTRSDEGCAVNKVMTRVAQEFIDRGDAK